ncbi:mannitol dehydrogenase family protein [Mycobacterium avium]|uniref:mannitol dehydrogenase family protein n=1 Tax=Mycobacterium avium TaxID=1764 RepID=UPI0001B5A17C|nr:mannitol dehydrogenase family protein [Mycobacterium avium]ETB05548.1 mannitol 2-dehydrogenase [Mycobacterium avium subsp. silvaticum ATCC 49884]ETB12116.1 mannitol 2-dehydrogenase [Mycobacterium avium subsp. avium 10-9275]ETB17703.1 mannitol 2-dehydrogenase [Mycobacterium avium subsp. avium 11-4751]ANR91219.1 mannitol dehydrogenase [Mycobacterium avium]AYJ07093.1 mannitol dehydrogenase family protein [Mycobacterium avium]
MKLNAHNLTGLKIPVPTYDRSQIGIGIAHFGVEGFHRAHQAMYLDRLLNDGLARDWGICGIGVLPDDRRMRDALRSQDYLYTLILEHPDGTQEPRVIGSIVDFRYAPEDPGSVVDLLADPATRIISLTITEGGYQPPLSAAFELVAEALNRRRERGLPSPTIVSCDNIIKNGDVARRAFTAHAEQVNPELAQWMRENTTFPNSMVDRITPTPTPDLVDRLAAEFGVQDAEPVVAEPFAMWVLEDDFADGRPPLDKAGVRLVDDVAPYEAIKLRLLNAGHQGLCYFAYLAGYREVHEAAQDPVIAEFLARYMDSEAMPTLPRMPGLEDFRDGLIPRFANAYVGDQVARLCADSSDHIPKWLLPVVHDNLRSGGPVQLSAAIVASWARYAEGVDEQGRPIEVVDRLADTLVPLARSQRENPDAFLANRAVFGDLIDAPRFREAYRWALDSLHRRGARATLRALIGADGS